MSSDEEDFISYGTPLEPIEEDQVVRKKSRTVEDQIAKDKYGRRRFHGAFTGGFSAGYFNSVGSADGWKPSDFKSSRGNKFQSKSQNPEDFMDDEDISEFGIAPKLLRLKSDYGDGDTSNNKRKHLGFSDGPIPGKPILQSLITPVRSSIGVKLLKKMGWKFGQGVGPRLKKRDKKKQRQKNITQSNKVYGCSLPGKDDNINVQPDTSSFSNSEDEYTDEDDDEITFAPDDYHPFIVKPKDNFFGIGYYGLDRRPVLSSHIALFEPSFTVKEKSKKFSIRGQGFGVGALEDEDEDIYNSEDMSQYDFCLENKPSSSAVKNNKKNVLATSSGNETIEGFVSANNIIKKKFNSPPKLPPGYQAIHVVKISRFEPIETKSQDKSTKQKLHTNLNALNRADILDENKISKNDFPSFNVINVASEPLVEVKKDSLVSDVQSKLFKPFISDPDKQRRYEQYLKLVKNGKKGELPALQPLSMTEWEREREKVEFEQAERMYRPISAVFKDRFVSATQQEDLSNPLAEVQHTVDEQKDVKEAAKRKMFGQLTRKTYSWIPSSLLCKRFNIRELNSGHESSISHIQKKRPKFSVFNFLEAASSNETLVSDKALEIQSLEMNHKNDSDISNFNIDIGSVSVKREEQLDPYTNILDTSELPNEEENCTKKGVLEKTNKEDLYKAIFLSSSDESEDEESENQEKQNKNTNLLIGIDLPENPIKGDEHKTLSIQTSAILSNVLRNNSPPRGIFANLNLDVINSRKSSSVNLMQDQHSSKCIGDSDKNDLLIVETVNNEIDLPKDICDDASNLYGPKLPTKTSDSLESPIKKIVEYSSEDNSSNGSDEWVECDKVNKKHKSSKRKKHKKEHKHKKHKKNKKYKR